MTREPFCSTFGTILRGRPGMLRDLDRAEVAAALRATGVVFLRGFDPTPDEFKAFHPGFGTAYVAHLGGIRGGSEPLVPERAPIELDGKTIPGIHSATRGQQGINPHSEASYSPMCPHLLWFFCRVPNQPGEGRTGFVDGVELLQALAPATRAEFLEAQIRWHVHVPRAYLEDQLHARFEQLAARWLAGRPGCTYTIHPDDSIEVVYVAPAIPRTRFGNELAFCNSLLSRMPFRQVEMSDLRRFVPTMSDAAVADAMACAHDLMHYLDWETGDIAFVDNSRVMHAREPFVDTRRTLWVVTQVATSAVWQTRDVA